MKKSFLKMNNSQYEILEDLIPLIHSFRKKNLDEQTYIEPFLGDGSVFLNVEKYTNFILNDINVDIYMLFNQIKNNHKQLVEDTKKLFTIESKEKRIYEEMSNRYNKSNNYYDMCQLYIYLNRHSFKGLMNHNENRKLIAKYGRYKNPVVPEKEIEIMHEKLNINKIQLFNHSYETVFDNLDYGDVIYCNDVKVNKPQDINEQQKQLVNLAVKACIKGSSVIITNTYNEITKELYKDCSEYYIKKIERCIAGTHTEKEKIIAIYA